MLQLLNDDDDDEMGAQLYSILDGAYGQEELHRMLSLPCAWSVGAALHFSPAPPYLAPTDSHSARPQNWLASAVSCQCI